MFTHIIKNPCAEVEVVPVLSDNFSYILVEPYTKQALCVDPAEPEKVLVAAGKMGVALSAVFCTHKHYDHSGGNVAIKRLVPDIKVYGSSYESVPGVTDALIDEEVVNFGGLEIKCIKAACHTIGHMLYYVTDPKKPEAQPILFTGDTVFIGGCGRFFEGSASMMLDIVRKVKGLRKDTLLYCGHEYTVKNLEFAKTVDKGEAVAKKLDWAREVAKVGVPTVPSLLEEELCYNPFLRPDALMEAVGEKTEEATLATLRKKKDHF
ncbi:ribonuclease Z/Hydroxyacylglutathione hydrolase like protein [Babesia gibsoni]|uniref:hydroxyacylglutathione hydrolase n=1 Tax=Babesia gibsoni TaxID=33632 RepID=A0AAD8LH79_BABGI|nr:ribonuclease Z/Hydroxyacylglutathione hydrolase like protein [Babesia gibsoni]